MNTYLYRFSRYARVTDPQEDGLFLDSFLDIDVKPDSTSADDFAQMICYGSSDSEEYMSYDRLSDVNGGIGEFVRRAGIDSLLQAYELLDKYFRQAEADEETRALTEDSPSPSRLIGLLGTCLKGIERLYRRGERPTAKDSSEILAKCKKDSWDDE